MRYDYECPDCGVMEISHSMMEDREGRECPTCQSELKPIISGGAGILLTGRPAWAYNDALRAAKISEESGGNLISKDTTISEKRDGNEHKGKKMKINKSMGDYNSQW